MLKLKTWNIVLPYIILNKSIAKTSHCLLPLTFLWSQGQRLRSEMTAECLPCSGLYRQLPCSWRYFIGKMANFQWKFTKTVPFPPKSHLPPFSPVGSVFVLQFATLLIKSPVPSCFSQNGGNLRPDSCLTIQCNACFWCRYNGVTIA